MTLLARQAIEIGRKDLRVEGRVGEALLVTVPFGATALLLIPLAVGARLPLLREVGWGLYWLVVLLFGLFVTLRHSGIDGPAQEDLLALLGIDPAARFLGRAAVSAALVLAFETLLAPLAVVFYDADVSAFPWLVILLPLVAVGLAALGTTVGGLTARLATRSSLAPLLIAPLGLPLLLAATQTLEAARYARPPWAWLLLLVTADVTITFAGVLVARPIEELST